MTDRDRVSEECTELKFTCAHTWQVVLLSDVTNNGGLVEKISDKLYRVDFPAKNGVGPIGYFLRATVTN